MMRGTGHFLNAIAGVVELSSHSKRKRRREPDADRCQGGCGSRGNCQCFDAGRIYGSVRADLDAREVVGSEHARDCGCSSCKTVREIAHQLTIYAISHAAFAFLPKDRPAEDQEDIVGKIIDGIINADWYARQVVDGSPGKAIANAVTVATAQAQRVTAGNPFP